MNAHSSSHAAVAARNVLSLGPDQIALWGIDEHGVCRCWKGSTCDSPGKHPTNAPYQPGDNVGNLTGAGHGVIVIDVDVHHGDGFAELERIPGYRTPVTRTVRTASGGCHLYFKHPGFHVGNGKLSPSIDVRGDKQSENGWALVVAPGSRVPAGVHTLVDDREPADVPGWLFSALLSRASTAREPGETVESVGPGEPSYPERLETFRAYCASALAPRSSGDTFRMAMRGTRGLLLPPDVVEDVLRELVWKRCERPVPENEWHKVTRLVERSRDVGSRVPDVFLMRATGEAIRARFSPEARHARQVATFEARRAEKEATPHSYEFTFGSAATRTTKVPLSREELVNVLSGMAHHRWIDVLRYDVFRGCPVAVKPPIKLDAEHGPFSEEDAERISYWLATADLGQGAGASVSPEVIRCVVPAIAQLNPINPIEQYFKSLPPSEGAFAELCDLLNAADDLQRAYVWKWLLSAARRALHPGCKADTILALRGLPGAGKSSFAQALFGAEWCAESLPNLKDAKSCGELMTAKWCVELAELAELFRPDHRDASIAFITRLVDRYRAAYGRGSASDHPRRCVFLGSANGHAIYTDPHGADVRRIWVLETGPSIDLASVRALRDRVWSEVYEATEGDVWDGPFLLEGEPHWLTDEEKGLHAERAAMFRDADPWQASIAAILRRVGHDDEGRRETTTERVLVQLGHDVKTLTKRETNRAANVLRALGCTELRGVARKGTKANVWRLPDDFPNVSDN